MKKNYLCCLFIFLSHSAFAKQCIDLFNSSTVTNIRNAQVDWQSELSELPHLNKLVQSYMDDPNMPLNLKYMLQKAFVSSDVEVRNFTKTIKQQYSFDTHVSAFAGNLKKNFKIKDRATQNANDETSDSADGLYRDKKKDGWFQERFFVAIEDGSIYQVENPLLMFMHEMAHVRFHIYFDRHISDLVGKFPADLVSQDIYGEVTIDTDLYSYLQERYAHEVEFTVLKTLYCTNYLFMIPKNWVELMNDSDGPELRMKIAAQIRHNYALREERLIHLDKLKISTILLNGLDRRYWSTAGKKFRQLFNF